MSSITLTAYQHKNLIRKSKTGWACFYKVQTDNHILSMKYKETLHKLISQERTPQEQIPVFVENELRELLGELNKETSCPICYEDIRSDNIKFSSCGHKYCEVCLSKISECSICRKKIYKKS